MKVKKLIAIVVLAALGTSARAQIVSSKSNQVIVTQQVKEKKEKKPKKPKKPTQWYGKVGISYDMNSDNHDYRGYWDDQSDGIGAEAGLGLKQSIGRSGAYWGAEVGFMTALNEDPDSGEVKRDPSIYAIPYVGWEFEVNKTISIAPYIGPFVSYGFMSTHSFVGATAGVNLWLNNKYAIGVNYKQSIGNPQMMKISASLSIAF